MITIACVSTFLLSIGVPAERCAPEWRTAIGVPGASSAVTSISSSDLSNPIHLAVSGRFIAIGGVNSHQFSTWQHPNWTLSVSNSDGFFHCNQSALATTWLGGAFTQIDGVSASRIARLNDGDWEPVGDGLNRDVNTIVEHQGDVYVGGAFWRSGSRNMRAVARWDGNDWQPLANGLVGEVYELASTHDGDLIAAGELTFISGGDSIANVARWDGSAWNGLGDGLDGIVYTLYEGELGQGRTLFAGGAFSSHVSAYQDGAWNPLGEGPGGPVHDLIVADLGQGPQLIAAGDFGPSEGGGISAWDGASWGIVAGGVSQTGSAPQVRALAIDPASGALVIGGRFDHVDGAPANNIAMLTLCSSANPADFNGDGVVGSADLAVILAAWGGASPDLDGDNVVGSGDLAALLAAWD